MRGGNRAPNIYHLALYIKSLLTPTLQQEQALMELLFIFAFSTALSMRFTSLPILLKPPSEHLAMHTSDNTQV